MDNNWKVNSSVLLIIVPWWVYTLIIKIFSLYFFEKIYENRQSMSAAAYTFLIKSSSSPIGVISFLKSPVELIFKSTKIFLK